MTLKELKEKLVEEQKKVVNLALVKITDKIGWVEKEENIEVFLKNEKIINDTFLSALDTIEKAARLDENKKMLKGVKLLAAFHNINLNE